MSPKICLKNYTLIRFNNVFQAKESGNFVKNRKGYLKKLSIFRILKIFSFYIGKASKRSQSNNKPVSRVKNGQLRKKNKFFQNCKFFKIQNFLFFLAKQVNQVTRKVVVYQPLKMPLRISKSTSQFKRYLSKCILVALVFLQ